MTQFVHFRIMPMSKKINNAPFFNNFFPEQWFSACGNDLFGSQMIFSQMKDIRYHEYQVLSLQFIMCETSQLWNSNKNNFMIGMSPT